MASKFLCDCGYQVRTNSFEDHSIYSLITSNDIDAVKEPITENVLSNLWFNSQRMVECRGCGTLYLWDKEAKKYIAKKIVNG